jgi:opacity protein-like surface antigen
MNRFLAAAALSSLLLSSTAQAQDAPAPAPTPAPAAGTKVKKTDHDLTIGLAWQGPTRLTGSTTFIWGEPKMLGAWAPAKLVQVRAGAGGGQFSLGLVSGVFEENPIKPSGIAVTLKAIALRTWRDPDGATDGNTYAGVESDVVILGIRGSIGYAWKVAGQGEPGGKLVWSIGLGL